MKGYEMIVDNKLLDIFKILGLIGRVFMYYFVYEIEENIEKLR